MIPMVVPHDNAAFCSLGDLGGYVGAESLFIGEFRLPVILMEYPPEKLARQLDRSCEPNPPPFAPVDLDRVKVASVRIIDYDCSGGRLTSCTELDSFATCSVVSEFLSIYKRA